MILVVLKFGEWVDRTAHTVRVRVCGFYAIEYMLQRNGTGLGTALRMLHCFRALVVQTRRTQSRNSVLFWERWLFWATDRLWLYKG